MFGGHPPNNQSDPVTKLEANNSSIFGNPLPSDQLGPQNDLLQISKRPRIEQSVENRNSESRAGSHDGRVGSKSHGAEVMMHEESKDPPVSWPSPHWLFLNWKRKALQGSSPRKFDCICAIQLTFNYSTSHLDANWWVSFLDSAGISTHKRHCRFQQVQNGVFSSESWSTPAGRADPSRLRAHCVLLQQLRLEFRRVVPNL